MKFGESEISQVVENAWAALLGWELALLEQGDSVGGLTASVGITGAWTGSVRLRCDPEAGRAVAGCLFGVAEAETNREMVCDALGELANIVAGNLKPLLGGTCFLGLPAMIEEGVGLPGGRPLLRVPFASPGGAFVVEVAGTSE